MLRLEFDELNKKQMLMVLLIVALLIFAQLMLMRRVKALDAEVRTMRVESSTAELELATKMESVAYYKSSMKVDKDVMPLPVESATKFYALLINILTNIGFGGADVAKIAEAGDTVSFRVAGESNYFMLLRLLSTLRQSSNMIRLNELELTGMEDGFVKFSFAVEAKLASDASREAKK